MAVQHTRWSDRFSNEGWKVFSCNIFLELIDNLSWHTSLDVAPEKACCGEKLAVFRFDLLWGELPNEVLAMCKYTLMPCTSRMTKGNNAPMLSWLEQSSS